MELKSGYDTNEISIVAKNQQEKQGAGDNQGDNTMGMDMAPYLVALQQVAF